MALNNPNDPARVARPRIRVLSNGVEIPNCKEASITSNNHFQADRFSLHFIPCLSGVGSLNWWAAQTAIPVDIQIGFLPPNVPENFVPSWISMQQGNIDRPTIDMDAMSVTVEGRDFSSMFIDNRTQDAHVNQTSSQIVTALAQSHGLNVQATTTTDNVGRFWASENDVVTLNQFSRITTEWDLIVKLAQKEQFDAFVVGKTLYFQPQTPVNADPYIWRRTVDQQGRIAGNVYGLHLERALTLAKGIKVVVKSWNAKEGKSHVRTYPAGSTVTPNAKAGTQQYVFQPPNLTDQQALVFAKQQYDELVRHEMLIHASLPGDMILTPRCMVSLEGTGTAFDQRYYVGSVARNVSNNVGFTMQAHCKNHPTLSQVVVG